MSDLLTQHPWTYPALRPLHLACVATSVALFAARGRSRGLRLAFLVAALLVVASMVGLVMRRHPLGWWAP